MYVCLCVFAHVSGVKQAVELTGTEFKAHVNGLLSSWLPAREVVERALDARESVHPSGKIIKLEQFCPWKVYWMTTYILY